MICSKCSVDPRQSLRHNLYWAKKRQPDSTATTDDLVDILKRQNGLCALSGIKMTWASGKGSPQPTSISMDRIDQSLPYHRDNIRLVCFCFNNFRGQMTDGEMRIMVERVHLSMISPAVHIAGFLSEVA